MKNFITLRSILSNIPSSLFQEANESDFIDTLFDGLKLLPNTVYYEQKIDFFEIIDGKVTLPKDLKQINSVTWQATEPSAECICDLQSTCEQEGQDINPDVCQPLITYKQWLDSPYFKENFKVLKYVGTDKSLVSSSCECRYAQCAETFVVTPQKIMYLSLDSGYICVDYDTPMCNEKGELLIPDEQILIEFLVAYSIAKHWENRQFTKEEQARAIYQDYNQKQAILFRQARGKLLLNGINFANMMDINGQYAKLIKIPEMMFYAK